MRLRSSLLLVLAAVTGLAGAPPRRVTVAAAADLRFALEALIVRFHERRPDIQVAASYGSSGNFYAQLVNHAPFDLFLSADVRYPRQLADQQLVLPGTAFSYAVGRIAVWVPARSPIAVERLGIQALTLDAIAHVSIANPEHAPYGEAAVAALRHFGVYDRVKPKLVYAENIGQALQFVQTGGADAGVVALSLALAPGVKDSGRYWLVPLDAYPPLEQGGAILRWAADPDAARAFRAFLLSDDGRAIFERFGFARPARDVPERASDGDPAARAEWGWRGPHERARKGGLAGTTSPRCMPERVSESERAARAEWGWRGPHERARKGGLAGTTSPQ